MTRDTKWQNFRKFLFCLLESVFQISYLLNCVLDVKRRSMKGFEPMGTIESFESLCQKMSMPPYKILKLTLTFFDFFRVGYDYRDIKINFGPQWGHAEVTIVHSCQTALLLAGRPALPCFTPCCAAPRPA